MVERAFALIAERAGRWFSEAVAPAVEAGANLHREVAALYGTQRASWIKMLRAPTSQGVNVVDHLKVSANRMVTLLPDRLKRSPKWLAAGATAGALSCVVAAGFISPVAIGALPMWSIIGAAVAAIVQPNASNAPVKNQSELPVGAAISQAVRSAALFTLLLEMQGRDEVTITKVLDRAITPDDDFEMQSANEVRNWLEGLRHRFDLASASEGGSWA
jgi:hypothetical protein